MSANVEELPPAIRIDGIVRTSAQSRTVPTVKQAFWVAIRNRTDALGFQRYSAFVNRLLCEGKDGGSARCGDSSLKGGDDGGKVRHGEYGEPSLSERRDEIMARPTLYGMDAYQVLLLATQAFVVFEAGVVIAATRLSNHSEFPGMDGLEGRIDRTVTLAEIQSELEDYLGASTGVGRGLPYLKQIVTTLVTVSSDGGVAQVPPWCRGILRSRFSCPSMLELIWSYWHEEGMLMQAINAIALRFQNVRAPGERDPLAYLEIDPLRALNNVL